LILSGKKLGSAKRPQEKTNRWKGGLSVGKQKPQEQMHRKERKEADSVIEIRVWLEALEKSKSRTGESDF
jgi:hypothetical protein